MRCWGDDNAPHGSSGGAPPDTPLVTFVVKRKSPGCRAERLHQEAQELPAPQKISGCRAERLHWRSRDFRPCKIPRGGGAERPLMGSAEGQRPSHIVGRRGLVPAKASGAEAPKRKEFTNFMLFPSRPECYNNQYGSIAQLG